jgi:hypothetical protein
VYTASVLPGHAASNKQYPYAWLIAGHQDVGCHMQDPWLFISGACFCQQCTHLDASKAAQLNTIAQGPACCMRAHSSVPGGAEPPPCSWARLSPKRRASRQARRSRAPSGRCPPLRCRCASAGWPCKPARALFALPSCCTGWANAALMCVKGAGSILTVSTTHSAVARL